MTMNYESGRGVAAILSWHLSGMTERRHKKTWKVANCQSLYIAHILITAMMKPDLWPTS
jgi:hypothetical protein